MKAIYTIGVLFDKIESATPEKETEKTVYFDPCSATNYRSRISKREYQSMPKSPQEAINRERTRLLIKLDMLNDRFAKLNVLEDSLKEAK